MKWISKWDAGMVLPLAIILLNSSCKKELILKNAGDEIAASSASYVPVTRAYHDHFDNLLKFIPDIPGGWTSPNIAPAWYPGSGEGNAAHMGNARIYFNQYTDFSSGGINIVAAPVTMFFADSLAAAGYTGIPSSVSTIVFDDRGNSIWFHQASLITEAVNPTQVNFSGTIDIIGGTGKFTAAIGYVTIKGNFNPQDFSEAFSWQNGWIKY